MSLSALLFLAVYFALLGLGLILGPAWGLVGYFWAFYRDPPNFWWGESVPLLRWSLIAATAMLVSVLIHGAGTPGLKSGSADPSKLSRPPWYRTTPARLLMALCAWMWLQSFWTINLVYHLDGCVLFTKYVVLFAILYHVIDTPRRMQLLFWCHVGGCFLWGLTALNTNVSGRLEIPMSPEGADSNLLGYHFATGVAFAGFLFVQFGGVRRLAALGALPVVLNGVLLTASRSATVAGLIGGLGAVYFGARAKRGTLLLACLLALPLGLRLAGNDVFWNRMDTLRYVNDEEEMEDSAASRVAVIQANFRMFLDHPFGVGYRGNGFLSPMYLPDEYLTTVGDGERYRAAHNSFMAYLVDQGFVGGLFMLAMVGWSYWRLFQMKRLDRLGLPSELGSYRGALAAGLTVHLVAGLFINLQKTETWFWMLTALASLDQLCLEAIRDRREAESSPVAALGTTVAPLRRFGDVVAPRPLNLDVRR